MPVRREHADQAVREPVDVTRRVVRQHHAAGVAARRQRRDRGDPPLEREQDVQAEPVHAEQAARVGQPGQVVQVVGVAAVRHQHAGQVGALLAEHAQRLEAGLAGRVGVHHDRRAGDHVRPGHRAHHPLNPRGEALLLDAALEERGPDAGAGDALGDVRGEQVRHRVAAVGAAVRPAVAEVQRDVVVGVQAGGHDDVDAGAGGHPLNPGDVAADPHHGRVGDGGHAATGERAELGRGGADLLLLVPAGGVVLPDLLVQHEQVLVHEHPAEFGHGHRPAHRLHGRRRSGRPGLGRAHGARLGKSTGQ